MSRRTVYSLEELLSDQVQRDTTDLRKSLEDADGEVQRVQALEKFKHCNQSQKIRVRKGREMTDGQMGMSQDWGP